MPERRVVGGAGRREGRLPDFVIIGAMKAATSSLHEYLDLHPDICMSRPKETRFFFDPERFGRGLDWYQECFASKPKAKHAGEASPHYTMRHLVEGVPERMREVLPQARLVYLVRDPTERIVSQWVHLVGAGELRRGLNEELENPDTSRLVQASRYHWQLEAWLEHYPAAQILVVQSERLAREPEAVVAEVLEFLAIEAASDEMDFRRRFHESSEKRRPNALGRVIWRRWGVRTRALRWAPWLVSSPIERPQWDPRVRERVVEALIDDVAALRRFTGQAFDGWSL